MNSTTAEAILTVVAQQNREHRHRDALKILDIVVEEAPDHQGFRIARGVTHMHFHEWAKALADFQHAAKVGEMSPELEVNLGEVELNCGDFKSGVNRLLRILKDTRVPHTELEDQPAVHRRAGFVLATFQRLASNLKTPSASPGSTDTPAPSQAS